MPSANGKGEKILLMRIVPETPLTIEEISRITGSELKSEIPSETLINGITTDSREICGGDLFVTLKGERFDGEEFIENAKKCGAYVLSKNKDAHIVTEDTLLSLLNIASYYKKRLPKLKKTVAVTGSVGKTTTKNILSKILSVNFKVHATKENYNNFLGLSHTLLTAPKDTEILVAEVGMNHPGEIEILSKALEPDVSIITNIGTAHIGNLGSRELIAKAKLEILSGMIDKKITVPYEEPLLKDINCAYTVSITNPKANCYISLKEENIHGSVFDIFTLKNYVSGARVSLPGRHVLSAIAHSIGAIELLGFDIKKLKDSLTVLDDNCVRGKIININGYKIFDDTYSSSPEAVIADFQLLSIRNIKKSCVLGDMLELGDSSEELHRRVGKAVAEYGFRNLYTFGKSSSFIAEAALNAGMREENVFINTDISAPEITAKQIIETYTQDETILFKASHSIHAERIYEFLKQTT